MGLQVSCRSGSQRPLGLSLKPDKLVGCLNYSLESSVVHDTHWTWTNVEWFIVSRHFEDLLSHLCIWVPCFDDFRQVGPEFDRSDVPNGKRMSNGSDCYFFVKLWKTCVFFWKTSANVWRSQGVQCLDVGTLWTRQALTRQLQRNRHLIQWRRELENLEKLDKL